MAHTHGAYTCDMVELNVTNFAFDFLEMNHYRLMNVVNNVEPLLIFVRCNKEFFMI